MHAAEQTQQIWPCQSGVECFISTGDKYANLFITASHEMLSTTSFSHAMSLSAEKATLGRLLQHCSMPQNIHIYTNVFGIRRLGQTLLSLTDQDRRHSNTVCQPITKSLTDSQIHLV
jgi:hypothetical protein